jgi:RNA polymerase sigma-70 factor (ECF subfamily)
MEGEALQRAFDEGRRAWPRVNLELDQFRRYLRRVLDEEPGWDWQAHAADLYLACACSAGDTAAHEAFEQKFFPDVEAVIQRVDSDRYFVAAALAALRARLFAGESKLVVYSAHGNLAAWLSVVATRVALDTVRERSRRTSPTRNLS